MLEEPPPAVLYEANLAGRDSYLPEDESRAGRGKAPVLRGRPPVVSERGGRAALGGRLRHGPPVAAPHALEGVLRPASPGRLRRGPRPVEPRVLAAGPGLPSRVHRASRSDRGGGHAVLPD